MKITDLKNYTIIQPSLASYTPPAEPAKEFDAGDATKNLVGGAVFGVSAPGRTIQNLLSKGVEKVTGKEGFGKATKEGFEAATTVDLDTTSGKVGEFVGEAVPFAVTGGAAGAATKGAGLGIQALAQGSASALTQAMNSGEIGKDELTAFVFGSASVPVGKAFSAASTKLSQELPEWLVKPLLKQAKDAKIQGKDIAPYLVKSGRVGTVDSLIKQTDDAINTVSSQIDDALAKSTKAGVTIQKNQIIDDVVNKINQSGGAVGVEDVDEIVQRLAPQAKGLLQKDTLTLVEANKLRSAIDKTLGDKGFLVQQLPFNKDVLRTFTNTLRESVKENGDESLRPLFDSFAKDIRLKNALLDRASQSGGANSLNFLDVVSGIGGFTVTGDPVTGLAIAGGRRAFESGLTKTALAKAFSNTDKVAKALEKASPATRAAFLELLSSLQTEDQTPTPAE